MTLADRSKNMESRTISCPKCGHVQEDGTDCLKCGIVFAKFYALHPGEQYLLPDPVDLHEFSPAACEEITPAEFAMMRQTVRDLARRFSELEFERVERGRLRSDLRDLDRKLREKIDDVHAAQTVQDSKIALLSERPQGPSAQDFADLSRELRSADLQGLHARQAQLERHVVQMEEQRLSSPDGIPLTEVLADHAQQINNLDERLKGHAAAMEVPRNGEMSGQVAEELEKLRASLQTVSLRYSEIGELKKNNLVLENKLDTLREAFDAYRAENQKASKGRIEDLGKEVSALRAEVRHAIGRLSSVETQAAASAPEVHPVKSDLDSLSRLRAADAERFHRELAALAERFDEVSRSQAGLHARLESLAGIPGQFDRHKSSVEQRVEQLTDGAAALPEMIAELNRQKSLLHDELQKSLARIDQIESKLPERVSPPPFAPEVPDSPIQDEMALIMQSLADIRQFMEGLSRKK